MKLTLFLGKLFNLRSGEWSRLLILYTMSLVTLTGLTWGDAIIQGAFLQLIGVRYLPWLLIGSAACSIFSLFIYTAFADRVSNTRLLIALLSISGVGILLGLVFLTAGLAKPAYILLYLVFNVPLLDVYNVHWSTYVNGFYDIRTAKRIIPVLSTAARLAGIIGGLSMPLMNTLFSPAAIIGVAVIALAIMASLAAVMPRLLLEQKNNQTWLGGLPTNTHDHAHGESTRPVISLWSRVQRFFSAYGATLRESYEQIVRSPFLRWMAISTFILPILMVLLNYRASSMFEAELKTTVAISDFLGVLGGVANLVILPFQLFLLSRLINRLGLGNSSLIYPLATLGVAGSLAIVPGLSTAAAAYLDRTALRTAFRGPIENLLYNAVPQRVKARTRAFAGGLVVPIGAILGCFLLLTPLIKVVWFLPAAILFLGLAFSFAGWMVRKNYGKALIYLLEQEDFSSLALQAPSEQEPSVLAVADTVTLAQLELKLNECTSPERAVFLAQLITAVGGDAAVPIVRRAAVATSDHRLRALLVDVLVAAEVRSSEARKLYGHFLSDSESEVRLAAVAGLEQIDGPNSGSYLEIAARLLTDPKLEVRLHILPALIAADDPTLRTAGNGELGAIINETDPHTRARALRIVGQGKVHIFLPDVIRSLSDPVDEVRLAAAMAAEELGMPDLSPDDQLTMLESVQGLLNDPIERVRVAAVVILGQLVKTNGSAAAAAGEMLIASLADESQDVRECVVESLKNGGKRTAAKVSLQLNNPDAHIRKMAAVVLARIDVRRYAALVRVPHIDNNLKAIYEYFCCAQALDSCPGARAVVMRQALHEWSTSLLKEIFYLLSDIQNPAAIKTVEHSLGSPLPEVRANAAEALESLTSSQTAALIVPLFEPDPPSEVLLSLAWQTWNISVPTPTAAIRRLISDERKTWQRTLAAATLRDLEASACVGPDGEIAELLTLVQAYPEEGICRDVNVAGIDAGSADGLDVLGAKILSPVRKIVLLRDVPFLHGMSIDNLKVLASACEEAQYPDGSRLFNQGDPGGAMYIVVDGCVSIEQEIRKGTIVQIARVEAGSFLGETDFFDNGGRTHSATAMKDTRTLCLRREPLLALARQCPDLSLELINVLSIRLRDTNERIGDLTRSHPQELHRLFDQFT